ncbi:hypothetical protein D3C77_789980 [compost metagenome]
MPAHRYISRMPIHMATGQDVSPIDRRALHLVDRGGVAVRQVRIFLAVEPQVPPIVQPHFHP